jgi:2-aminoadipate transaminase
MIHTDSLRLADWTTRGRSSAGQDLMAVATSGDVISFCLGLPAPELFPSDLRRVARSVLDQPSALQYGVPCERLKSQVVSLMARRGVRCTEEEILITSGAQQGISLALTVLVERGSEVLCEEHTYFGFQQAMQSFDAELLTVPTDLSEGLDVEAVERLLARGARPRLLYVVPTGHNPLGVNMSAGARTRLVEIARRYGVAILEDDPYGFLSYDGEPEPPLRALDEDWVIYVGSFSKLIAPSLRVGWLVAPRNVVRHLGVAKAAADIETATLGQRLVSAYLDAVDLDARLSLLRGGYRVRRDAMLGALCDNLPGARWSHPSGGFFVWVELQDSIDTAEMLPAAVREGRVAYVPGSEFRVGGARGRDCRSLRLCFSTNTPGQIAEGMVRLRHVVERLRH